tara:strand:+ start:200 stop:610 length:411 start_codon:yes stop_codon:yes gene_type:complete
MSAASEKNLSDRLAKDAALLKLIKGAGTVKGDELNPMSTRPLPKGAKDKTGKVMKSVADLFKSSKKGGKDAYSDYEPGDWGSDSLLELGAFADADWVLKKGGSVKKGVKKGMKKSTKKSIKKRAALRGQRSELRGS